MFNALDTLLINAKFKMANFVEDFKKEEKGVSAIVATVLLIVIVVALAAIFWDKIKTFIENTLDKTLGDAGKIGE